MFENFSFEQKLHAALGGQSIEEVKAVHAYTHALSYSREEWDNIWYPDEKNATWAHGFGRFCGWREVWYNNVTHTDIGFLQGFIGLVQAKRREDGSLGEGIVSEFEGHDFRSAGSAGLHALASPIIEVAEDGKSARSFYLTPGTMLHPTGMNPNQTKAKRDGGWLWERYGSDFVYKDGKWLYIHEQVCPDVGSNYGPVNWGRVMYEKAVNPPPARDALHAGPAHVSEPWASHNSCSLTQTVQHTAPIPWPYNTLDDENSYAPGYNNID